MMSPVFRRAGPRHTVRYPIRRDAVWRPLLAVFGGISGNAFVEVDDERVRFRFGWLFDETAPRREIVAARRVRWSVLRGIGWRIGPLDSAGLIGSRTGVVEVEFRAPRRVRLAAVPWRVRRIAVSVQDPDALVAALTA